ncbi:hypothetical protein [Clostridium akagii]|uniref:hypothetical protein n=1 Tax=Clostridium akagii TaxID=91623 RepID=UPI00047B5615|nr:hypothetical protein [Clostridium akagii]
MLKKRDERVKIARNITIRYTYFFEILLIPVIFIASSIYKNVVVLSPIYLFKSLIHISISLNQNIVIIISTQILVLFITQAIFNKRLGGKREPLVSGTNSFRFMDERERIVADESIFVTFVYINIFFIIWGIYDIFAKGELGISIIIIVLQIIFYIVAKFIILCGFGEKIS